MKSGISKRQIVLATVAAIGSGALAGATMPANAAVKTAGKYVAGDFHNHSTCSDGSISMQKLVQKSTVAWSLDWFVQAGHGGSGNRNCTLVEDASLATPAYPTVQSPTTTWTNSIGAANIKGDNGGVGGNGNMWRWQSLQEFQYPLIEYLSQVKNVPLYLGVETVVPGHEHTSMAVITGQMPNSLDSNVLPNQPPYNALGNDTALAQWEYCFDRADGDLSQGNVTGTSVGNNWDCSVPGSANAGDANWSARGHKLNVNSGVNGHNKTLEALKWMKAFHPNTSYYVPAHLERAGPFNVTGSNGFNVEHLRDMNNSAPDVAFGMETQPGHGASQNRGEYQVLRNNFGASVGLVDSVGGTTYGGTGVYGAQVGGVWDALLGEGRNFWFFASSDWHNRGQFGADDRRTTQDFQPGEYQRNYTMVRNGADKIRPQSIVDGLRTGNNFASSGQLIDRLGFVACASFPGPGFRSNAAVEALALNAAKTDTSVEQAGCAGMGEKLTVRPGSEIVVSVVVRDPAGTNNSPYTFNNPSLAQDGINQPLNAPVLDHVDLIQGLVTGYKTPGAPDYSGEWPRNTNWLKADGTTAGLSVVPAGAKNTSAAVIKTFSGTATTPWTQVTSADGTFTVMTYRIPAITASQYVRLRGTNLPPATPSETDASGNPLADVYTNAGDTTRLTIACDTPHSGGSQFDGCPDHLGTASGASPIAGHKAVSFDIAAWADLWFYSNPVYVQVTGSTMVAGVK